VLLHEVDSLVIVLKQVARCGYSMNETDLKVSLLVSTYHRLSPHYCPIGHCGSYELDTNIDFLF